MGKIRAVALTVVASFVFLVSLNQAANAEVAQQPG